MFDNNLYKEFIKMTNTWVFNNPVADSIVGLKFDSDKAPLHLLDAGALRDVAEVFGFGAKKYAKHNWRKGIHTTRLLDSVGRHLLSLQEGVDIDEESQLKHAAHAICGLMMFIGTMRDNPEFDDRYIIGAKDGATT